MFLRKLREILMDLADNLIVALFAESIRQDLLERFFLGLEGDRRRRAEAGVNNSEWSSSGFFEKYRML